MGGDIRINCKNDAFLLTIVIVMTRYYSAYPYFLTPGYNVLNDGIELVVAVYIYEVERFVFEILSSIQTPPFDDLCPIAVSA